MFTPPISTSSFLWACAKSSSVSFFIHCYKEKQTFSKGGVLLVFTSPIVTSSVTRPLDNVFAGTDDEGELVGDMAIVPSVIWACAEGSPISRGSSFCIHCHKEKRNRFITNEIIFKERKKRGAMTKWYDLVAFTSLVYLTNLLQCNLTINNWLIYYRMIHQLTTD